MQKSNFDHFADCWAQACEGCGKQATPSQINWAFEVLRDKSIEQVKKALIMHARDPQSGQYQPKPADIIRHIEGSSVDRKTAAEAVWRKVLDNVNRYDSAVFDDPAIHYAIMIGFGSWLTVCDFDKDDFAMQQMYRSFISAYASYNGQPYIPRMIGIYELESAKGETRYEIHYIGDKQKALMVERGGRVGGMEAVNSEIPKAIEDGNVIQIGDGG